MGIICGERPIRADYLDDKIFVYQPKDKLDTTNPPRNEKIKCINCGATKIKYSDCSYCGT